MTAWLTPEETAEAVRSGDGAGVRIALLDSGVEIGHPEFSGRSLRDDWVMEGERWIPGEGKDVYGHGTALASILWKLAPAAEVGSFRVLGPHLSARSVLVARAAERAVALGYDVINCSFTCGLPGHLPLYKSWTDRAARQAVTVVAASGSPEEQRPEWPAHLGTVLGVDCGPGPDSGLCLRDGSPVEFLAPGAEVDVAWNQGGRRLMTGSSFAAAHLSGLVARILSRCEVRDALLIKAALRACVGKAALRVES